MSGREWSQVAVTGGNGVGYLGVCKGDSCHIIINQSHINFFSPSSIASKPPLVRTLVPKLLMLVTLESSLGSPEVELKPSMTSKKLRNFSLVIDISIKINRCEHFDFQC